MTIIIPGSEPQGELWHYKRESVEKVENTDTILHNFKKRTAALLACFVVLFGVVLSYFYYYYQDAETLKAQMADELAKAQQQIEELSKENGTLKEQEEEAVAVLAQADGEELLEIPFEVNLDDWNYILVNELHPLSRDFEPQIVKTYDGQRVDERIKEALETMIDDAKKDGMNLLICSSYRDYKKQDSLMDKSIAKYVSRGMTYTEAFFKTKEQIALTGASEHHTGLAVDIVGKSHQSLDSAQADTKEAKWLNEHAVEYGFILRYPEDKEEQTMIYFESWHYRYVGKEAAAFMKEHNLCLEEFVELAEKQQELKQEEQANAAG